MSNTHAFDAAAALQLGQEVLTQEAGALTHLASTLGSEFTDAVSRILSCKGRLIVSGVGKSGHIGRKLALGDALAVATLSAKGFTKEDFARSHPGGALGRRLLIHVQDIMRTGEDIPAVREEVGVLEAVREITKKHIGMTAVVDDQGRVTGIFTEGDLRRLIERLGDIRPCVMKDVMIRNPKTIRAQELAASAVKLLDTFHCNQLLVVDEDNRLIGALHLHDLMGAKVL